MIKVAINGFGRIGRCALRQISKRKDMEVVAINDLTDPLQLAYLYKYDSVHRMLDEKVASVDDGIEVNGKKIKVFSESDPSKLPWKDLKVDIVLECTGVFTTKEKSSLHINAGAKKVTIGMTHVQTMVNVIMPQALRNIIPQIGNNFIINIKDTSVMFVIGFVEFFATHRNIVGVNLLYFPSAVIEMAGYLMLTLAASFLLRWLEKRLDGSDNYELVSTDSLAMSAGTYSHPSRKTPFDERSGEFDSGRPKGEY